MSHHKLSQAQRKYLAELSESETKVATWLFHKGQRLVEVRSQMAEYTDLDSEQEKVFDYLLFQGGLNDFDEALRQTKEIERIDRFEECDTAFNIPDRLRGMIDYEIAWNDYCSEASVFEIDGQWYRQEE